MSLFPTPQGPSILTYVLNSVYDEREIGALPLGFSGGIAGRPEAGGVTRFSDSTLIEGIDIIRANRDHANMIKRGSTGASQGIKTNIVVENWTSALHEYGLMEVSAPINSDQTLMRTPGESPYNTSPSRVARQMYLIGKAYRELVRQAQTGIERLAAQAMLTGKHASIFGSTKDQYNFQRNPENIYSVPATWAAAANPKVDLGVACGRLRKNGFVTADTLILGTDAWDAYQNNDAVQADINLRRSSTISINQDAPCPKTHQRLIDSGFVYGAYIQVTGGYKLHVFTYVHSYNKAGTDTPFMPVDQGLLFTMNKSRCDRYFGPKEALDMSPSDRMDFMFHTGLDPMTVPTPSNAENNGLIAPNAFHADIIIPKERKSLELRVQVAPIIAPVATDTYLTLTDLV